MWWLTQSATNKNNIKSRNHEQRSTDRNAQVRSYKCISNTFLSPSLLEICSWLTKDISHFFGTSHHTEIDNHVLVGNDDISQINIAGMKIKFLWSSYGWIAYFTSSQIYYKVWFSFVFCILRYNLNFLFAHCIIHIINETINSDSATVVPGCARIMLSIVIYCAHLQISLQTI